MLNPIHLRTLQVVLRVGSFADAGRVLGYTGSAVSQQMSALERQLGAALFVRTAHALHATSTARFLAERSLDVLGRLRTLEDDIASQISGNAGSLRVGGFSTAGEQLIPDAFAGYLADHPGADVRLHEGQLEDIVPLIAAGELDMAVAYRYGRMRTGIPHEFHTESLLTEDLYLLVPAGHGLAGGAAQSPEDGAPAPPANVAVAGLEGLSDAAWISTGENTPETRMLRILCGTFDFRPRIACHVLSYEGYQALIRAGMGIGIVPAMGYHPGPGVAAVRVDVAPTRREVLLIRSHSIADGPWEAMRGRLRDSATAMATRMPGIHVAGGAD